MKIKTIIIVVGMLLPILSVRAQEIKPLSIGDTVPDLVLHNVINYKDSVIRISDFKDKLVILDFWATWCGSCIAHFPDFPHLEDRYRNELKILLVNADVRHDNRKRVEHFFELRRNDYVLTSLVEDTLLSRYFPHASIPHIVWIKKGLVVAITGSESLHADNIHKVLASDRFPSFQLKGRVDYDSIRSQLPLYTLMNLPPPRKPPYSFFCNSIPDIQPGTRIFKSDSLKAYVLRFSNLNAVQLLVEILSRDSLVKGIAPNRTVIHDTPLKRGQKLLFKDSLYNYELAVPIKQMDKKDAERVVADVFNVGARLLWEHLGYKPYELSYKDTRCMIIRRSDSMLVPKSSLPPARETNIYEQNSIAKFFRGLPLRTLVKYLNNYSLLPVFDESNLGLTTLDLQLPDHPTDLSELEKSLSSQGFSIQWQTRRLPFLHLFLH